MLLSLSLTSAKIWFVLFQDKGSKYDAKKASSERSISLTFWAYEIAQDQVCISVP